jgi:hypothetical protein
MELACRGDRVPPARGGVYCEAARGAATYDATPWRRRSRGTRSRTARARDACRARGAGRAAAFVTGSEQSRRLHCSCHNRSVHVVAGGSERGALDQVAEALEKALQSRVLRVPPLSRGAIFTVEVESRVVLPSGHDNEFEVSINALPLVKTGKAKKPVKFAIVLLPYIGGGSGTDFDPTDLTLRAPRASPISSSSDALAFGRVEPGTVIVHSRLSGPTVDSSLESHVHKPTCIARRHCKRPR